MQISSFYSSGEVGQGGGVLQEYRKNINIVRIPRGLRWFFKLLRNCNDFENRNTLMFVQLSRNCNEFEKTMTALYSFLTCHESVTISKRTIAILSDCVCKCHEIVTNLKDQKRTLPQLYQSRNCNAFKKSNTALYFGKLSRICNDLKKTITILCCVQIVTKS